MNDEFTSNDIANNESFKNIEDSDYKNLLSKLKDIKSTIALLEKNNLDKF